MSAPTYSIGSLFAGVGGLEKGLEMTGRFQTAFQVEINPWARQVLAKHWPHAARYEDVRRVGKHNLPAVDVLCGGFPCQDVSFANPAGLGLDGERSGLWREYARLVGELRPRLVIVENVSALLVRGLDRVLADLAALGFDAEWITFPASSVGAPHRRERVFVVAYPAGTGREGVLRDYPQDLGAGRPEWARAGDVDDVWGLAARLEQGLGEPIVFRDADGVPGGLVEAKRRLTGHGNAVVPQQALWLGDCVLSSGVLERELGVAA